MNSERILLRVSLLFLFEPFSSCLNPLICGSGESTCNALQRNPWGGYHSDSLFATFFTGSGSKGVIYQTLRYMLSSTYEFKHAPHSETSCKLSQAVSHASLRVKSRLRMSSCPCRLNKDCESRTVDSSLTVFLICCKSSINNTQPLEDIIEKDSS